MNTKLIMTLSATFLAVIGLSLVFLSNEIAAYLGITFSKPFSIICQILGALYFAFAMLNWMAKGATIGGIYNRPIAIANFTHFLMGALALIKTLLKDNGLPAAFWILAGLYILFALAFWRIAFVNPVSAKRSEGATA